MNEKIEIIIENFPWFSMSETHRNADKNCAACCCAMCVEYFRPNSILDIKEYIDKLYDIGDETIYTTFSRYWFINLERKVVNSYGVNYKFSHTLSFKIIDERLKNNLPTVIAFKHRQTLEKPTGVHACVVIGKTTNNNYIVHDPLGDLNNDYSGDDIEGRGAIYKREDLVKRWCPKGNTGWGGLFSV
jgi:hypothetical protein